MTLEEALVSYWHGHGGLSAQVGDRTYPLVMPENVTYPAMVYQRISSPRVHSHDGPNALTHARFRLTCWGRSFSAAKQAAKEAKVAMAQCQGVIGGPDGVTVQRVNIEDEADDTEVPEPDTILYRSDVEVVIWHEDPLT